MTCTFTVHPPPPPFAFLIKTAPTSPALTSLDSLHTRVLRLCYLTAPPPTPSKVNDDPRRRAVLDVSPTSALLPPNGRVPIEVTFCPREEKFHNFNLLFNVRKKQTKLSINVKGEGFKASVWKWRAGKAGRRTPDIVVVAKACAYAAKIAALCSRRTPRASCGLFFCVCAGISRSDCGGC